MKNNTRLQRTLSYESYMVHTQIPLKVLSYETGSSHAYVDG
jgi:hypothetical protein